MTEQKEIICENWCVCQSFKSSFLHFIWCLFLYPNSNGFEKGGNIRE